MGCKDCEKRQEESLTAYYRWKTSNMALNGCDKHLREVFEVLNFWQKASREGTVGLLLRPESWENLFNCIRESRINSEGNFWAALQEIERQFAETNPSPSDETVVG